MNWRRLLADATCLVVDHSWRVDAAIDAGRGSCARCGRNEHAWLPVPKGHPIYEQARPEWRVRDGEGA